MIVPLELTSLTRIFSTPSGPFIAVKDVNALITAGEFEMLAVEGSRDEHPFLEIEQMPGGRSLRGRGIGDVGSDAQELLLVFGVE